MLLEICVGDSLGVGFEYINHKIVEEFNKGFSYRQHPTHVDLKPGMYSDDTMMSVALTQSLLENKGFVPEKVAQKYLDWYNTPIQRYFKTIDLIISS